MGFFSFLSGSNKAMETADNVVDGAIKGIDALFFTDEEKSRASVEVIELVLKRAELAVNESSVRSIPYILMTIAAIVIYKIDLEWAEFILDVMGQWKFIIGAIVLWFFGSYGVGYIVDKSKSNK